jgi:hypothetical protein
MRRWGLSFFTLKNPFLERLFKSFLVKIRRKGFSEEEAFLVLRLPLFHYSYAMNIHLLSKTHHSWPRPTARKPQRRTPDAIFNLVQLIWVFAYLL